MKNKPSCIHYISNFLPITEVWIYNQIKNLTLLKPVLISRYTSNNKLFPFEPIYSLKKNGKIFFWLNIFISKIIGFIPFFYFIGRKENGKILHVHFGYHGIKLMHLKKALGIPMVCSFYGTDAFRFPFLSKRNLKNLKLLFTNTNIILALGPYMKKSLIKLGCPADKIIIHHLGIEINKIEFRKRLLTEDRPIRFLMASSFVDKKGIDIVLKALSVIKTNFDFTLDIIGDGVLRDQILSLIDDLKLGENITFHGYKPYDFLISLSYECDVFLQASRTIKENDKEGTPMVIVDMMATGMPVISTKHSDIPEIIDDGINGYLAEENDVDSFKNKILELIANKGEIQNMSEKCRKKVETEFCSEKQKTKLEKLYLSLT